MEKKGWVDFDKAKAVSFDLVIDAIGLREQITRSGEELRGVCPLPAHTGSKEKDKFFINVGKGVFKCHQCKKGGNVLDFAMAYHGKAVKDAAVWLIALETVGDQSAVAEQTATGVADARLAPPERGEKGAQTAELLSDFDKGLLCGCMSVMRPQLEELLVHAENPVALTQVLCGVLEEMARTLGEQQ